MEDKTMEWSWRWAFWRRGEAGATAHEGTEPVNPDPKGIEEWEAQLIEAGVSSDWAPRLARRLEPLYDELGRGSARTMILTAAAAVEVQAEAYTQVGRNLKDVKEVERLLGAFGGELEKLDEVLEVLSAYAQRMRNQPAYKARHTLH
jgi:hypothetical protein